MAMLKPPFAASNPLTVAQRARVHLCCECFPQEQQNASVLLLLALCCAESRVFFFEWRASDCRGCVRTAAGFAALLTASASRGCSGQSLLCVCVCVSPGQLLFFSPAFVFFEQLLSTDPLLRPDIVGVSQLIAPLLMQVYL